MKSRITANARSGASGITACLQSAEPLELHEVRRQGCCDVGLALDRVDRVIFAAKHQRRAADTAEPCQHVEGLALAAGLAEPAQHLGPADRAPDGVGIARNARVVRHREPPPCIEPGLVRLTADLQETPPRQRADFGPAKALEQLDAPLRIGAADRLGADQNEFRRVIRMARRVGHRDHAAERGSQHDRIDDAERIAEGADVVAPLRERPALPRPVLAAAVAAMIEIDDLGDVRQGRIGRAVDRMVGAGTAMQQQQCRLFPHDGPVGHELRALDIEEQPYPVHRHVHGAAPFMLMNGGIER